MVTALDSCVKWPLFVSVKTLWHFRVIAAKHNALHSTVSVHYECIIYEV